jgi:hypothetical protein
MLVRIACTITLTKGTPCRYLIRTDSNPTSISLHHAIRGHFSNLLFLLCLQ